MDYQDLISAIKLMWHGMCAIFIVMIVISVIVYLFTRITEK